MINKVLNEKKVRCIAFYLPQYHPIPENDEWWGKGFTEWNMVKSGVPRFAGHYQPHIPGQLGYYDLRDVKVRSAQANIARMYGIHGFCYYYYWFNGKRLLEFPLDEVLKTGEPDFPFCLCWANENWTRRWDGREREILMEQRYSDEDSLNFINNLIPAFRDKRYIRVNGKPLFLVYRTGLLPNPRRTSEIWQEAVQKAGVGELYLVRVENFMEGDEPNPEDLGFNAAVEFAPYWKSIGGMVNPHDTSSIKIDMPEEEPQIYDYVYCMANMLKRDLPAYKFFRGVFPMWDNSARRKSAASIFINSSPEKYRFWLSWIMRQTVERYTGDERIVFINAWNEWGEGCHLEPDERYGIKYLEATRDALILAQYDKDLLDMSFNDMSMAKRLILFLRQIEEEYCFALNKTIENGNLRTENSNLQIENNNLDHAVAETSHALAERDGQIASLNQVISERDVKIAILSQVISERDGQIAAIYNSCSWRITRILRVVDLQMRRVRRVAELAMSAIRRVFKMVVTSGQKNPEPDVFLPPNINNAQYFPRFFRGVPSYEFWMARKANTTPQFSSNNDFEAEGDWSLMLPATAAKSAQGTVPQSVVDVIIPVYRGLNQTRRCIDSVLNSMVRSPFRLIVINDASPEIEVTEYLRSLPSSQQMIVIENAENLGFAATVNRGMSLSKANDVLLLNSDTEVANDWIDKLKAQAYSGSRVGSVTPFSNNATICNYPTLAGMKKLPDGESVKSLDTAFACANKGRNIEIPTAVGFCMYIRRDCLNAVGLFDVDAFGKGYGEENDFCLRATIRGWIHLLAADTFVFHEGEVSFQTASNPGKERAMKIMRDRYPAYEADVAKHVANNEAYPLRVAATAARFRQGSLPVVLHVLHALGGGVEKHVEELCRNYYGKAKLLIMTPLFVEYGKTAFQIRAVDPVDALDIHLPVENIDFLVSLIQSFGVSLVHIHHVLGYPVDLQYLIEKLGMPFYLTVHDYNLICPRINLMPIGKNYCGEPQPSECNSCLAIDYPQGAGDIIWWRESHAWLFNDASVVICPCHDVAKRCQRYFPNAIYRVVAHEKDLSDDYLDINVPVLNKNEPLRVAILGILGKHKGIELIAEALLVAEKIKAPLQFQLIGCAQGNIPSVPDALFSQTGSYIDAELVGKIEIFNPHLILFPAVWPETYSYTLTAAMKSKRPVMVTNLGAFPERVALRPWTWLMDWNISPAKLVNKLCEIRVKNFYTQTAPVPPRKNESDGSVAIKDSEFYENEYLSAGKDIVAKGIIDIRTPGKITALVLLENAGAQPSPCAYIRLILPLIRERGEKFNLRWVTVEQVTHYVADVLISQRTAVTSIAAIDKIAAHCRENNIRIVYELDDLLLALPENHPEHANYAPKSAAVFRWLLEADEVWVSTEILQHHVCQINPCTHVVPNYIDDNLWVRPKMSEVRRERKDPPVRLLYMGTPMYDADFELVKEVLKRLKNEFSDHLEVNLIGIYSNLSSEKWCKIITPPQAIGSGYPAFVNWICNGLSFDIGIAPLVDNEFNRCKSEMKFLDYSALGLATVASDLNGYALIRNGENGFRVKNTAESWYEILKTLITDSTLRNQIQLTAQNEIFEKYGYGSVAGYRTKLLRALLSENVKRVDNTHAVISREIAQNLEQPAVKVGRNTVASAFLSGVGIELGALHNPLPVPGGAAVKYVDRMDKPGLYEQYPELRQHNLVDVDFVDNGETLLKFTENSQDFIIANHFLEHCEDPIRTLKAFFRVLRTGGVVYCTVPSKSKTFDRDRPTTPLHHLVEDHERGAAHSRKSHYEEWVSLVEPHFERIYARGPIFDARVNDLMSQRYSIHYHCWEAEDFKSLLYYLKDNCAFSFNVILFLKLESEYIAVLRKEITQRALPYVF